MSEFKTTILQIVVHREEDNPVFGENNTYVSIDDETSGPFLVIQQLNETSESGKVKFDYTEFIAVTEAAKLLMHQLYIEKADVK